MTKHIAWRVFDAAVDRTAADRGVRTFTTKDQLLALLYGQLAGTGTLRGAVEGLTSHGARLYHAGMKPVARSTFADANAKRPYEVFQDLFNAMARQAGRGARRHLADAVRLLDATKVKLSGLGATWARFSKDHCAAKVHIVYDPHEALPARAEVTPDNVNDIEPAKALKIEPGMTYVFDLAYYSFDWWAELDAAGCRFVTRLKKNTKIEVNADLPVPAHGDILSDRIGHLPERMARSRKNPFQDPVREVTVKTDQGKILRLVTNDLDAPAEEIAALYKLRWEIELFFKWIKQNLKIKHFIGTSENAVKIQIYVALIAYLILSLARKACAALARPQSFARLVRLNIMSRRPLDQLDRPPKARPPDNQCKYNLELAL